MTINIQYVHMATSEAMNEYVAKKLKKLSKKYDWIISTKVYFDHENHPQAKGKICKMELSLPGPRIFAASNEKNYELAVKETIKDLERQLKKRKEVFKTH
ncbi:MAG: ribosome-associated translation inhibitor RaiA [Flavobacteriaceae bacterium]|nr:ribosome-associated translation inhibitor RaiA [Flavobacteriaceae bacterium]